MLLFGKFWSLILSWRSNECTYEYKYQLVVWYSIIIYRIQFLSYHFTHKITTWTCMPTGDECDILLSGSVCNSYRSSTFPPNLHCLHVLWGKTWANKTFLNLPEEKKSKMFYRLFSALSHTKQMGQLTPVCVTTYSGPGHVVTVGVPVFEQ